MWYIIRLADGAPYIPIGIDGLYRPRLPFYQNGHPRPRSQTRAKAQAECDRLNTKARGAAA